eukprot:jgi/Botrbrau1/11289/Bobra.0038s0055.1
MGTGAENGAGGEYDFDLFTIGAGSGGVRAARFAASTYGIKAAICELPYAPIASDSQGGAGGTCVLRGCVPKKLMYFGSEFAEAFKDSVGFGWDAERPPFEWTRFMENKDKELHRLNGVYKRLLEGAKVRYLEGRGRLLDPHTVEVDGRRYTARVILIATGARASVPPLEGAEHAIMSDQILNLPELPKKLAIIGAGFIGVEFAGIFNNFGTEVHLIYRQALPLRGFDEEARRFLAEQYIERGVNVHAGGSPKRIVKGADGKLNMTVALPGKGDVLLEGLDHVLMATGRKPNTANLGLEQVGVELEPKTGAIKVRADSQTSVPSIYAIGDVTNRMNLTPVALMEAMAFAHNVFWRRCQCCPELCGTFLRRYSAAPRCRPSASRRSRPPKQYGDVDVYTSTFRPMKNTISGNAGKVLMKILVDPATDKLLGMLMIGPEAGEIIQGFAVAVKWGLTKKQLDSTVGIHPTAAEELVTMRAPTRKVRSKAAVAAAA